MNKRQTKKNVRRLLSRVGWNWHVPAAWAMLAMIRTHGMPAMNRYAHRFGHNCTAAPEF